MIMITTPRIWRETFTLPSIPSSPPAPPLSSPDTSPVELSDVETDLKADETHVEVEAVDDNDGSRQICAPSPIGPVHLPEPEYNNLDDRVAILLLPPRSPLSVIVLFVLRFANVSLLRRHRATIWNRNCQSMAASPRAMWMLGWKPVWKGLEG